MQILLSFFQDTSKFLKTYRLYSFKKEFAKWIDMYSVFQLCSWKYCLQITWFSLLSFGDPSLDNKRFILPLLYTFHIHLSASLSSIIRSNYGIFKLDKLWVCVCMCGCVCAQSCPTLYSPLDCSPLGSSVYGISQARIPDWADI